MFQSFESQYLQNLSANFYQFYKVSFVSEKYFPSKLDVLILLLKH